jgi:uncharacterized protein
LTRLKVAVVGSGVSGLTAAWLLSRKHEVVLYESDQRLGGHAHTVDVNTTDAGRVPVDTGFIVYNTACYPNLIALFEHLDVETAPTRMSFAVSLDNGAYEYGGSARGLVAQPSNLLSVAHFQLIRDTLRFFREAPELAARTHDLDTSLADWLSERRYSRAFVERHIRPMAAAIWSTPSREVLDFPAAAFARFFANHGLLQIRNRPQWRTVVGGSRSYVTKIVEALRTGHDGTGVAGSIRLGVGVRSISKNQNQVTLRDTAGATETFDRVIVATHPDQALAMLNTPTDAEQALLSAFRYAKNNAILHTDTTHLPRRRKIWSAWNYIGGGEDQGLSVSYHMNTLQPLATQQDFVVTLNPVRTIRPETIRGQWAYEHPIFDRAAMTAQRQLHAIQGQRGIYFAGAYMGFGFHECGAQSGLLAAELAGGPDVRRPWSVDGASDRMAYHVAPQPFAATGSVVREAAE